MAVYVDAAVWPWRGTLWCHLLADDLDELHRFARQLGLERSWFQHPPKASAPHYDLTLGKRAQALLLGADEIDRRTTVIKSRALSAQWATRQTVSTAHATPDTRPSPDEASEQPPRRSPFPHPRRKP